MLLHQHRFLQRLSEKVEYISSNILKKYICSKQHTEMYLIRRRSLMLGSGFTCHLTRFSGICCLLICILVPWATQRTTGGTSQQHLTWEHRSSFPGAPLAASNGRQLLQPNRCQLKEKSSILLWSKQLSYITNSQCRHIHILKKKKIKASYASKSPTIWWSL